MYLPFFVGVTVLCLVFILLYIILCLFWFHDRLDERAGCFALIIYLKSGDRLISVVDVVMNPYQLIPFHILSFAVLQSRILIYAGSNIIAEEEKVFERKNRVS